MLALIVIASVCGRARIVITIADAKEKKILSGAG